MMTKYILKFVIPIMIALSFMLAQKENNRSNRAVKSQDKYKSISGIVDSIKIELDNSLADLERVRLYNSLGELYTNISDDTTYLYSSKAIYISRKIGYNIGVVSAFNNLATILINSKKLDSAKIIIDSAFKMPEVINDIEISRKLLITFSNYYIAKKDYPAARNKLMECSSLNTGNIDDYLKAYELNNFGVILQKEGKKDSALVYFDKSIEVINKCYNKLLLPRIYLNIGLVYRLLANYEKGIEFAEKGLQWAGKLDNNRGLVNIYNLIGGIYYDKSDYPKSIVYFDKALTLNEKTGDKNTILNCYINTAAGALTSGNWLKATEYYEKIIKIGEEVGDLNGIAMALGNMAIIHTNLGNLTKALEYSEKSLKINEQIGDEQSISKTLNNLGIINRRLNNYDKAIDYYEQFLKLTKASSDKKGYCQALINIANLNNQKKKYQSALDLYDEAMIVANDIKINNLSSMINLGIGQVYQSMSYDSSLNISDSIRRGYLLQGVDYKIKAIDNIKDIGLIQKLKEYKFEISDDYYSLGEFKKSIDFYREATILKDSLFNLDKIKKISEIQANKDLEIRNKENEKLRSDSVLQYKEILLSKQQLDLLNNNQRLDKLEIEKKDLLLKSKSDKLALIENEKLLKELELSEQIAKKGKTDKELEIMVNNTKYQNIIKNYLSIAIAFLVFSIFMLFMFFYRKKKDNKLLTEKNKIITDNNEQLQDLNFELRENEIKLTEAVNTKDKFFSIIAHDLKNPLGNFKTTTELLSNEYNDFEEEERKEFIDLMKDSSKNIYDLLENLLEWSRSQRGKIEFNPIDFNLNIIVNNTLQVLKLMADNKTITLKDNILDNTFINGDPNLINTIVRNLVSNAIKFTPEGGVIEVGAKEIKSSTSSSEVHIYVKDSGVGMKEETIAKLFKIAENVTNKGTSGESGTGLGLILCKEFVEKHGGRIWVESEEGKGSTFYFSLPYLQ